MVLLLLLVHLLQILVVLIQLLEVQLLLVHFDGAYFDVSHDRLGLKCD